MKRFHLVILLLFGQLAIAQSISMGVTGNIHKSSIANIHDYSKTPWGGGVGLFAEVALVENDIFDSAWLYLVPQIEYSMQGENAAPPQGKQKFPANYVGVPIYIKYFFHQDNMKRNLFLFGGPRFEFMVSHDKKGPPVYEGLIQQEAKISEFGYGISLGAGVKLGDNLEAFVRFDRGLSKVYPDSKYFSYNRLLGIGVNYFIFKN